MPFVEKELGGGFVMIACGLPCTGKTTATKEVARVKHYPILRSDLIRQEVLKNEDIFDEAVAANMERRAQVYDEMFRQAEESLKKSEGVILDATFLTQSLRRRAAEVAVKHNLALVILETRCSQEVALRRIRGRTRENYESNAITETAYFNNKKLFEAVDLAELKDWYPSLKMSHVVVDTRGASLKEWYVTRVTEK